jgi:hypothetical protein
MSDSDTQSVLFPELLNRPVSVAFDGRRMSSDGGALLLKAVDKALGLTGRLADAIRDRRDSSQVTHSLRELLQQRIFGLACGYEDANDAAAIRFDPIFRMLLDRDPFDGTSLASQPTLSRFENAPRRGDLIRLATTLAETVLDRQATRRRKRPPRRMILDLDSTENRTYGNQQLSLFNGHYGNWCYLPLVAFVTFDDEPEEYLLTAVLRSGTAGDRAGLLPVLSRLLEMISERFGAVEIVVRLDGGFANVDLLEYLEAADIRYVLGFPPNTVLERRARRWMGRARVESRRTGKTATFFSETRYAARTWKRRRRVVYKAEVVRLGGRPARDNSRFVVTNFTTAAEEVWSLYRTRGDSENRIKELKLDLSADRTSASRFLANQFRWLMAAAAYVLIQHLREPARSVGHPVPQAGTLRTLLFKIGARVERSVRRIVVHLVDCAAGRSLWLKLACHLGASPT